MLRIGVDLGGTKTEIIALDTSGQPLLRRRIPTPRDQYPRIIAAIVELVDAVEHELGEQGTVGVATPGALSNVTGCLKASNTPCLNDRLASEALTQIES